MASTIADVYSGSYGDTSLPRFDLSYTRPAGGNAVLDLASDNLPLGPLATWYDLINGWGLPTLATATSPTVVQESGKRVVRFNGTSDQMLGAFNVPGPLTIAIVGRVRDSKPLTDLKTGGIRIGTGTTNYWVVNDGGIMSGKVDEGKQTIIIASIDGASSAMNQDGIEYTGTLTGAQKQTYIGFGTNTASTAFMPIDISRFIILPYAASKAWRRKMNVELSAQYG